MLELLSPRGFRVDLVLRYFDCTPKRKAQGKKQRRAVSVRHTFVAETVINAHAHTRCCFPLCKPPYVTHRWSMSSHVRWTACMMRFSGSIPRPPIQLLIVLPLLLLLILLLQLLLGAGKRNGAINSREPFVNCWSTQAHTHKHTHKHTHSSAHIHTLTHTHRYTFEIAGSSPPLFLIRLLIYAGVD